MPKRAKVRVSSIYVIIRVKIRVRVMFIGGTTGGGRIPGGGILILTPK